MPERRGFGKFSEYGGLRFPDFLGHFVLHLLLAQPFTEKSVVRAEKPRENKQAGAGDNHGTGDGAIEPNRDVVAND